MFEFLFKRPGDKPDETTAAAPGAAHEQRSAEAGAARARQAAHLAGLGEDEAGAADFILHSEFSELRLAAAAHIHSVVHLERVHAAIRNTDRRVAKLMQSRLDAIRHHQAELGRGAACIAQAGVLLDDAVLTPNHVADLDRNWSVIAAPELGAEFDAVRAQLGRRLEAQVDLQRAMIDRLSALRKLGGAGLSAAELAAALDQMGQAQAAALAAPEHASLPRSLAAEFAVEHARLGASLADLAQDQLAAVALAVVLAEWEAAPPATLQAATLRRRWEPLAAGSAAAGAELRPRFEALLASLPAPVAPAPAAPKQARTATPQPPDPHFVAALEAMEAALREGALGVAAEHDKTLKDAKGVRPGAALAERLVQARAELKRLSDWARWGGNVSREELIKAVEQLPAQKLAMGELAKKVGSMRERWKGLDTLSGSAPKSLWERFDNACTAAYAPAAAHFKQLADERHGNAARAAALLAETRDEAARSGAEATDWKRLAATVQRLRLAWSHLGAIDRKEKKRLDQDFAAALHALQGPLEGQRQAEVASREELIAQVTALDAQERHSLDTLRHLQERWQEHARALPLERKAEQALWRRFRAACDAVFAKRKEGAHAADAERRGHQEAKEALCARLEAAAAAATTAADAAKLLRDVATQWHAIGPVPRAGEAKLDLRYQAALAVIERHVDGARRQAAAAQASALRDKLRLCQALEAAVAGRGGDTDDKEGGDWTVRWAALPTLGADYDKALQRRFDAALTALTAQTDARDAYAALLGANSATVLQEVLRLEIACGVDSGSDFARDRLKLRVEALRSSLKSGARPQTPAGQFLQLCATPALVDARTASRIEQLFNRIGKDNRGAAEERGRRTGGDGR